MTLTDLQAAFSGQRVFLTGHTGFKGAWLTVLLEQLGAEVYGYSLPPAERSLYRQLDADSLCTQSDLADLNHYDWLAARLRDVRPHYVLHLAAQSLVRRSYREPRYTFGTNTQGTVHLLDAVREAVLPEPCAIVAITTDKVYANPEDGRPFTEDDPLGGHDPYSASKAAAEIAIDSYRKSFFAEGTIALASARAGNVIGAGDWADDRIIPDFVRAAELGQPLVVRNPAAVRPWQHAIEPLYGYLVLAARLRHSPRTYARAYNFGPLPTDELSVREVVEQGLAAWPGHPGYRSPSISEQPHEAGLLRLDVTRARSELGWQPRLTAAEAIALTISGYRTLAGASPTDARAYVQRVWREYLDRVA
jgi:CDP-glucose 4,6-dehydratase